MNDPELRGQLLTLFHTLRNNADGWVPASSNNVSGFGPVTDQVVGTICRGLADAGLIQWRPPSGISVGLIAGMARITGLGVDVVQRRQNSPIIISFGDEPETMAEISMPLPSAPVIVEAPSLPALRRALQLADEIESFPLEKCGPSDDPDEQYAYTSAFRDTVKRFAASVRRLGDAHLNTQLAALELSPEIISEAHDLKAELIGVIDFLRDETERLDASAVQAGQAIAFDELLHPRVREASIRHYQAGDYRNAVLDGITAVFDRIRERTGLDLDGEALITQAFSVAQPMLIFSEISSQSGKNDQIGFIDIFRGAYRGIRNPKAHSLTHDLDAVKAGQYLVLASLMMRRVTEAVTS